MSFMFTHLIIAWFAGIILEKFTKKKLSYWAWAALLVGGIIPDGDLVIDWAFNLALHRTYSHSLLFLLITAVIGYLIIKKWAPKENAKEIALLWALGVGVHLALDMIDAHGIMLLFPLEYFFSYKTGIALKTAMSFPNPQTNYAQAFKSLLVDSILGMLWVLYHIATKKIRLTR